MIEYETWEQEIAARQKPWLDLGQALHLTVLAQRIAELEAESLQPEFWLEVERAKILQQELSQNQRRMTQYNKLGQSLEDMQILTELANEAGDLTVLPELRQALQQWDVDFAHLRLETYFTGEHDQANALLTLHAGAGGIEAMDWTAMLFRMYSRWSERQNFGLEVLDYVDGEEAGLKSIAFKISGANAYGLLKSELGVHRLVRISPFDNSGRRHTSFASLEVVPELDDSIEIDLAPDDLRVDYYRASGAGGQHINKTSSAVRLTHLPTGVVVACQNERSQIQNKETALRLLRSKLYSLAKQNQLQRIDELKGEQMDNSWGSQIRSYVFCPYTMVKDNRTQWQSSDVGAVMDGDLDGLITAYLASEALKQ